MIPVAPPKYSIYSSFGLLERTSQIAALTLQLDLAGPFPPKGAGEDLKQRVVRFMRTQRLSPGERFLTETEVAERSGLSRSTVRRAMDDLQRDGWVERQVGRGTFVGPRVGDDGAAADPEPRSDSRAETIRIGVLVDWQGSPVADWYSPSVLQGIDRGLRGLRASVELLTPAGESPDHLREKLEQSPPDVLVCLAGAPRQLMMVRDAQRLGIPVLCTGAGFPGLGLPRVQEDNRQATRMAYDHLVGYGHERIGLVLPMKPLNFAFERLRAFRDRREEHTRCSASDVLLLAPADNANDLKSEAERVVDFVETFGHTALISGSAETSRILGYAAGHAGLAIPDRVSMVSFDQSPEMAGWLGLPAPTTVAIPLEAIGQELARCALALHRGDAVESMPIRCDLIAGETVSEVASA